MLDKRNMAVYAVVISAEMNKIDSVVIRPTPKPKRTKAEWRKQLKGKK